MADPETAATRKLILRNLIEETMRTWHWKDSPEQMSARLAEHIDDAIEEGKIK